MVLLIERHDSGRNMVLLIERHDAVRNFGGSNARVKLNFL